MKIKVDQLGRFVIPINMRKELNITDSVNVEYKNKKIIITNDKEIRSRDEIKGFLADLQQYNDDISKGMKYALEWTLNEDLKDRD